MFPFVPAALSSPAFVRDVAAALQDSGAESVWTAEHVVFASDYEPSYPYSTDGRMPTAPGSITMPDPGRCWRSWPQGPPGLIVAAARLRPFTRTPLAGAWKSR
jgi:hypothetical protein